jgi:hypothetical protein
MFWKAENVIEVWENVKFLPEFAMFQALKNPGCYWILEKFDVYLDLSFFAAFQVLES